MCPGSTASPENFSQVLSFLLGMTIAIAAERTVNRFLKS